MTSSVTTAQTTSTTGLPATFPGTSPSTSSTTPAPAALGRASERLDFRSASARLRENAGINDTAAVAAVTSVAAVGAAARRLRASNTFAEPSPAVAGRCDHPSFAPPVLAPVLVPVLVPVIESAPAAAPVATVPAAAPEDAEEPIVIDLPACEVIYLDPQVGRRKLAAHTDRELRRASLAHRAADLLATIEDAKREFVLT